MTTPQSQTTASAEAVSPSPSLLQRALGLLNHPKAPVIAGAIIIIATVMIVMPKNSLKPAIFGGPNVVVFDPVKFLNAQRAAASILMANPSADLTLTMTQVAKQSELVIKQEAGGALVLIKQSVVLTEDIPDITDAVLKRFGLPTTGIPTVTTRPGEGALESIVATDSVFSAGKLREDYRLELEKKAAVIAEQNDKVSRQASVLP